MNHKYRLYFMVLYLCTILSVLSEWAICHNLRQLECHMVVTFVALEYDSKN